MLLWVIVKAGRSGGCHGLAEMWNACRGPVGPAHGPSVGSDTAEVFVEISEGIKIIL